MAITTTAGTTDTTAPTSGADTVWQGCILHTFRDKRQMYGGYLVILVLLLLALKVI